MKELLTGDGGGPVDTIARNRQRHRKEEQH
jgi:hypothetical protein